MVLFHCNAVNSKYQHDFWALSTFFLKNVFGHSSNISPTNHVYREKFCSEFLYIKVWFTDQNSNSPGYGT